MKTKYWLFLLALCLLFACAKDEPAPQVLKISTPSLHFSGKGGNWQITVTSNCDWKVEGATDWCTTDTTAGSKTASFVIHVDTNRTTRSRSAQLSVTCDQSREQITIQQDTLSDEYHYKLPVIFHVLYSEETDSGQNVPAEILHRLIAECNAIYANRAGKMESVDMNLELVAATEDPDGNPLTEQGIQRTYRSNSTQISCESFMTNNTQDVGMMWDPNRYINVFIYTFTEENVLGISHMPFTPKDNSLPGLAATNAYYSQLPTALYGISLNNLAIHSPEGIITLSHELGHYLGLFHVFDEEGCEDTDYCEDTPTYNRAGYMEWLEQQPLPLYFPEVAKRTDCSGYTFTSYNIMDYDFSYQDRFTADQYLRVRHVLENSPLIPGPKNIIFTRSTGHDEALPARVMK